MVNDKHLRFDFSHFKKLEKEEIRKVERLVNDLIRQNIQLDEKRNMPIQKAREMGAMSLFGEKYGDVVRVVKFGDSVEFCGGTHVKATGEIGYFIITVETATAAGIRRIEALTSMNAEKYINARMDVLDDVKALFKNPKNLHQSVAALIDENTKLKKQIETFQKEKAKSLKADLLKNVKEQNGINVLTAEIQVDSAQTIKDIAFQLKGELENLFLVLGSRIGDKANIAVMISDNLVKEKGLHAGNIIRDIAKEIQGGGGGQPFFATAGGKNPDGLQNALQKALSFIQ